MFSQDKFLLNLFVASIFFMAKSRASPPRINRRRRGAAFASDNKVFSIWAERRDVMMKSVEAPRGISWKVPPTRPSFSLCRDRPVQAFSFLVYPDTLSLGVSACRLITRTHLSEIILVFPHLQTHIYHELMGDAPRRPSSSAELYAWKHTFAMYFSYNLFLLSFCRRRILPLCFLM